jgi:hypothetical protein
MAINYEKINYPFEREPNEGVINKVFFYNSIFGVLRF